MDNVQSIELKAHAKVNLSLEVVSKRADGYHDIISFMQDVSLYDEVYVLAGGKAAGVAWAAPDMCVIDGVEVYFSSDSNLIPVGMDNLAMRGAGAVLQACGALQASGALQAAPGGIAMPPAIGIRINKKLPIAAGIAGGSGNAAAAMLGVNKLLGSPLTLSELMKLGASIGADVPFSLMMNAYRNREALAGLDGLEWARPSAMTGGIGDIVEPCDPITRYVIMVNPGIAVSTGEAYKAIDSLPGRQQSRPDGTQEWQPNTELFYNVFEEYACDRYPEIRELIEMMNRELAADRVVMSGSGSTVVAYYVDEAIAKDDFVRVLENDWAGRGWRIWYAISGGCR